MSYRAKCPGQPRGSRALVTGMRETALIRTRLSTFFNAFADLMAPRDGGAASKGATRRSEFAVDAGRAMLNGTCIGRIVDEDHLVSRDERRCPVGARLPHPRVSHGRT